MTNNKPGILNRPPKFEPSSPATPNRDIQKEVNKKIIRNTENKFTNQQSSLKISAQSKLEIETLMKITNTKFNYEMLDSLIDFYVSEKLTVQERKKFKVFTEM